MAFSLFGDESQVLTLRYIQSPKQVKCDRKVGTKASLLTPRNWDPQTADVTLLALVLMPADAVILSVLALGCATSYLITSKREKDETHSGEGRQWQQ
jgi:hypothetical protein